MDIQSKTEGEMRKNIGGLSEDPVHSRDGRDFGHLRNGIDAIRFDFKLIHLEVNRRGCGLLLGRNKPGGELLSYSWPELEAFQCTSITPERHSISETSLGTSAFLKQGLGATLFGGVLTSDCFGRLCEQPSRRMGRIRLDLAYPA